MCMVSAVTQFYDQTPKWNWRMPEPITWPSTTPATLPWTKDSFDDLKEILKRVKALDDKLGLADCEDPKKAEWVKAIEDRLKALEQRA